MKKAALCLAIVCWVCFSGLLMAATPTAVKSAESERRLHVLSSQLRCLVCQNQSLAESNADLAVDLRNAIREKIEAGQSDDEILDFMSARYGDFILYRPPFKALTLALWLAPPLFLVLGFALLFRHLRRRPSDDSGSGQSK